MYAIGWGIDVGVGSVGFAVLELDKLGNPVKIIDGVTEIFPASIGAVERRTFKSNRVQNKRERARKATLKNFLCDLFSLNPAFNDPPAKGAATTEDNSRIRLRANGLVSPLTKIELAQAIMHISNNRGQRLSRGIKTTPENDTTEKERSETRQRAVNTAKALSALGKVMGHSRPAYLDGFNVILTVAQTVLESSYSQFFNDLVELYDCSTDCFGEQLQHN